MTTTEAQQILDAVTKAANAASEAAQALREANEQSRSSRSGFSEASKVVKVPEAFGNSNSADDQSAWLDFSFSFKAVVVLCRWSFRERHGPCRKALGGASFLYGFS